MTRVALLVCLVAASVAGCAPAVRSPGLPAPIAQSTARPTPLPVLEPIDVPHGPAESAFFEALSMLEDSDPRRRDGAVEKLVDAMRLGFRDPLAPYALARLHAIGGRKEDAFAWLEKAVEAGWCRDGSALREETLASLRGPRFDAILATMRERAKTGACWEDPELSEIYDADQADRHADAIDWRTVRERDRERRERVHALLAAGRVKSASDHYKAALVFLHGDTLADYERARSLAYESAKRGFHGGLWLTAAAWDRWLMTAGHPQRFGTQFHCPEGKPCEVVPLDPATTPEERARWGVPDPHEQLKTIRVR